MKKSTFLLILSLLVQMGVLKVKAQNKMDNFTIDSKSLQEVKSIKVALPIGYEQSI